MGWLHALATFAAAFSPALVLFGAIVAPRPDLVILMMISSFGWMLAIMLTAAIWMALVPFRSVLWLVALYAVVLQEASRWLTYTLFARLMRGLQAVGIQPAVSSAALSPQNVGPFAIASGLGVGTAQIVIMYGDVLWASVLPGSLYTSACTSLSVFGIDALCSACMIMLNVLLSLIGWTTAYPRRSSRLAFAILALHLLACGATALNANASLPVSGCVASLSALPVVLLLAGALAAHCWASSIADGRRRIHSP